MRKWRVDVQTDWRWPIFDFHLIDVGGSHFQRDEYWDIHWDLYVTLLGIRLVLKRLW